MVYTAHHTQVINVLIHTSTMQQMYTSNDKDVSIMARPVITINYIIDVWTLCQKL